jgi:hypothetical protein
VLVAVFIFLIRNCYCWCEESEYTFHPLLLPAGCEVLSIPEPWLDSQGSEIRFPGLVVSDLNPMMFGVYEFRRSTVEGEFLVALQSKFLAEMKDRSGPLPPSHYSRNKFAFQFPWMASKPGKIHSVRAISGQLRTERINLGQLIFFTFDVLGPKVLHCNARSFEDGHRWPS